LFQKGNLDLRKGRQNRPNAHFNHEEYERKKFRASKGEITTTTEEEKE